MSRAYLLQWRDRELSGFYIFPEEDKSQRHETLVDIMR